MSGRDLRQNNVDLYTGEVSFSLPLATLPGPNGMELSVEARYTSAVLETATTWNVARPTGILGLGWSLPTEAILADYAEGTGSPAYYLAAGGQGGPLACTGTNPDGTLGFLCENLSFWSITYSPAALAWTVVRENGDTAVYGAPASPAGAVEWAVAWGNWSGASSVADGQAPVPLVFHLASISNRFGDRITFEYDQVLQTVGGAGTVAAPAFTQACYLRRIRGAAGDVVELSYAEKTYDATHREYQDPHTSPAPPNPWQDRFETRYLSAVAAYGPGGTLVSTQTLVYADDTGQTVFLGTGDISKRALLAVVRTEAGAGASLPAPRFTYWGMDTDDGVSAATPYSATTHALYGALKTATLPAGGTVTYQYTRLPGTTQEAGFLSTRQKTVAPPAQAGVTFSQPRFHLRDRYAVATWLASDTTLRVQAYWWDGRWLAPGQAPQLDTVPLSAAPAYATAPVAASERLFGVYAQNQVHLYAPSPLRPGSWILPSATAGSATQAYFTTAFAAAEPVTLAAGDTLAAALGLQGGALYRYRFDGAAWNAEAALTLAPGGADACYQCAASGNWLLALGTAKTQASDPLHLALHYVDGIGAWRSAPFTQPRPQARIDSCTIHPGSTFALCALQGTGPTGTTTVSYVVLWWQPGFSGLAAQGLGTFDLPAAQVPTPYVGGSFVALGEMLYRFDGRAWRYQNVHAAGTLLGTRYGVDTFLRTVQSGSQYTYSLRRYDPNTGAWAEPQTATAAQGTGVNLAATGTRDASPYAVLNGTLLYQKPDGTVAATGTTLPALTGDDALSAALPGGRYLVYQSGGNVVVQVLRNGAALAAVTLAGQSVYTGAAGLTGAHAFVTYTGTYGASDSTLTLNRVVAGAPSGAIALYPVSAVLADNGYATVSSAYLFGAATALARADGWGARYNQATTVAGTADPTVQTYGRTESYRFNGLAPGETPALAYPVDADHTNAPTYYGFVAGLSYAERTFAAAATTPDSQTTRFWWVYTAALGTAWAGAYTRQRQVQAQVDGVATSATSDYSALTGLATRTDATQWNAQGVQETLTTLFTYFWEQYDPTRALNLLTPVIQTTTRTTAGTTTQTTGMDVVTYRADWGHGAGQWAPERSYRARSAGAAIFTSWQAGQADPAGWLRTRTVTARGAGGEPLASANAFTVPSSFVYDASGLLLTAAFGSADAGADECGYYGFEGYEDAAGWGWSSPSGSLADYITTADYHTGGQCLLLPPSPGETVGPVRVWAPAGQGRTYLFGAWVKTESGFDPAQGAASWQIGVYTTATPAQQVGATLTLPFGSTGNQWAYLQQTVNLPALRAAASLAASTPLVIRVWATNLNTARNAYVDDLRFSPLDAGFAATVYDPVRRRATASLGANGETYRVVYDEFSRVVAAVGPGETVKALSAESLSRDQGGGGAFVPEFPNSVLGLSTTSASAYYDFHDADPTQWTFDTAGGTWAIQGGRLGFAGTSTDPLGSTAVLKVLAFTNFAVRVVCPSHTASAGVGNGDVFVLWNQTAAAWQLVRRNASGAPTLVHATSVVGFRTDWVFAIVDGVVLFFAGGVQLFAWSYSDPNTQLADVGKVALVAGATAGFDDLVVLNDPQLSMTFRDGFGTAMQSVSLLGLSSTGTGYPSVAQGSLFDALGRPYVSRNPGQPLLALDLPQGGSTARYLVEGDQATYLVGPAGQALSVDQYLGGAFGYDYTQQVYENSPLSRVLQVINPRETGQPAAHFTVAYAYGPATAALVAGVLPSGTAAGNYAMESVTDQNGTTTYQLSTVLGQPVATRTALGGGAYHTEAYGYDPAGNLTTVYQPNYFQPPAGSVAAAWVETRTYTFNGLLSGRATPDAGATTYLYDDLDRLRFAQDADGAAASPPLFVYYRYDALNRLVETGYVQDVAVTLAVLQTKVNDPAYPDVATVGGKWRKRVHHDATDTGAAANLVGRVWKVEVSNNANTNPPDTQVFAYDADGCTLQETSVVRGYGTDAYVTAYTYDNLKNVATLQYPARSGETPLKVGYTYDRLGRLAAVGKPVDPGTVVDPAHPATGDEALYAAYAYASWGGLVQESLNNRRDGTQSYAFTRGYTYNQPGWLRTASDPFFSESLDYYEQPGYGGASYYNGQISRAAYEFPMNGELCPPSEYAYLYGYDALGRLQASQSSAADAFSLYAGTPEYDANGNRATLRRGATTSEYGYRQSSSSQQVVSNRLYQVTDSVSSSLTFDGSATVWTWGASNAGPSASVVKPRDGGGSYLQLAGGSLGHYEYLELDTYLSPAGTCQLSCSVRTPTGWLADTGLAGWYLTFAAPTGTFAETLLGTVPDTAGQWQSFNLSSVDVPALLASLGPRVEVASVSLQLRNYRRKRAGAGAGSSFDVAAVSLQTTASVVGQPFTYSAAGNVTAAPSRGISSIAYDPVIGLTTGVTAGGATTTFEYDGQDARSLATSSGSTRMYLRGKGTRPLRIRTRAGAQEQDLFLIHGARGVAAFQSGGGVYFPLTDHLGSTRAVVNSSNQPVATRDYLPFGGTMRASGPTGTDYLYTGHELDRGTGLYDFGARLYDPALGRFYATDPVPGAASPYVYASDNPVLFVDPDGRDAVIYIDDFNSQITVQSEVVTYGPNSTAALAASFQADISGIWHNRFNFTDAGRNVTYSVGFDTTVTHRDISGPPWSAYLWPDGTNYMSIDLQPRQRSFVAAWPGHPGWYGTWYDHPGNDKNLGAHEFGHLLGLIDRYVEQNPAVQAQRLKEGTIGNSTGYHGNIMRHHWEPNVAVFPRDIEQIVGPAVAAHVPNGTAPYYLVDPRSDYREKAGLLGLSGVLVSGLAVLTYQEYRETIYGYAGQFAGVVGSGLSAAGGYAGHAAGYVGGAAAYAGRAAVGAAGWAAARRRWPFMLTALGLMSMLYAGYLLQGRRAP